MLPAQGRSLVPPTNFAGYGVVEVARLSKTFPFQARAQAQPPAPLHRDPRLSAPMLRGPAIPSLHPPHSLLTIRPEPPPRLLLPPESRPSDSVPGEREVRAGALPCRCFQGAHQPVVRAPGRREDARAHQQAALASVHPCDDGGSCAARCGRRGACESRRPSTRPVGSSGSGREG